MLVIYIMLLIERLTGAFPEWIWFAFGAVNAAATIVLLFMLIDWYIGKESE